LFDHAKKSGADVVVTIDGDGQFLPEEIPKLIGPVAAGRADVVLGYRYDSSEDAPSYRMLGNRVLDRMTKTASGLPFRSSQGGFRAYSRRAIQQITFSTDGFGVDSEILISASEKGLGIVEEGVTCLYNTGGKTSTKNPVVHMSGVMGFLLESIAMRHPLRYIGIPGIALIVAGLFLGWYVLAVYDEIFYFSLPFTFASLALLLVGILLMMVSVVLFSIMRVGARR
ncbi:MAG: glycosyltransferase family 2 protein, partial [Nitrosopumilus sp.]|nr:glycosyltransferase family 2 protein [Nitrosopumilus sp.]